MYNTWKRNKHSLRSRGIGSKAKYCLVASHKSFGVGARRGDREADGGGRQCSPAARVSTH